MRPLVLAILDGWGYSPQTLGNAIKNAPTPYLDEITKNYPSLLLQASGTAVGMTWGESGNSEVGHLTIGAGRVIFQYLTRINEAIKSGSFFDNPVLSEVKNQIKTKNSNLHLVGLLTSGSVHAYLDHLLALLDYAKKSEIRDVKIHLFLDGRDSGLKESIPLLEKLNEAISKRGIGEIVSVIGRDFAMDRNNDLSKTAMTHKLLTEGEGEVAPDLISKIKDLHGHEITDPQIPPLTIDPKSCIKDGDAVIFFNFREDSMRQLVKAFMDSSQSIYLASMTKYLDSPMLHPLFLPPAVPNSLSDMVAKNNLKQFHIAETEKYAHVTYFFNGLRNEPFPGETDVFIDSHDNILEHPEMKAAEIADRIAAEVRKGYYGFIVANFANGDMLSHLGNLEAAVKGVSEVDMAIGKIKDSVLGAGGVLVITSDHGNAESLVYKGTGEKETKHNDNPVPFYVVAKEYEKVRSESEIAHQYTQAQGILADVAPTVLKLMGIEKPDEMTGTNLLELLK